MNAASFPPESIASLRAELARNIADDESLRWLLPATITTDEFLAKAPTCNVRGEFNPGALESNIRAATEHLDRAVARRAELVSLEEVALRTFLAYSLAEQVRPYASKVHRLSVRSDLAQVAPDEDDGDETDVDAMLDLEDQARHTLKLMHSDPGNPLNYGERIALLREYLTDTLSVAVMRLQAIRIGMAHFGIRRLPKIPQAENNNQYVFSLIAWLRQAITTFELACTRRNEFSINLFLGWDGIFLGGPGALLKVLKSAPTDGAHTISFSLAPGQVRSIPAGARIIDASVSLALDEDANAFQKHFFNGTAAEQAPERRLEFGQAGDWMRRGRSQFIMSSELTTPRQTTALESDVCWSRPIARLYDQPALWCGSNVVPQTRAGNGASPFGDWSLKIFDALKDASGTGFPIRALSPDTNGPLWNLRDVVISLRLDTWIDLS